MIILWLYFYDNYDYVDYRFIKHRTKNKSHFSNLYFNLKKVEINNSDHNILD